jgi:hypothetical protein
LLDSGAKIENGDVGLRRDLLDATECARMIAGCNAVRQFRILSGGKISFAKANQPFLKMRRHCNEGIVQRRRKIGGEPQFSWVLQPG